MIYDFCNFSFYSLEKPISTKNMNVEMYESDIIPQKIIKLSVHHVKQMYCLPFLFI